MRKNCGSWHSKEDRATAVPQTHQLDNTALNYSNLHIPVVKVWVTSLHGFPKYCNSTISLLFFNFGKGIYPLKENVSVVVKYTI